MENTLKSQILALDQLLTESEKQATAMLARVRSLRRKANAGELVTLPSLFEPLPRFAQQFVASVQAAQKSR